MVKQSNPSLRQPDPDTLFSYGSVQPFVPLYAVLLGQGGHIVMNVVCIVALWFVCFNPLLCYIQNSSSTRLTLA